MLHTQHKGSNNRITYLTTNSNNNKKIVYVIKYDFNIIFGNDGNFAIVMYDIHRFIYKS